jgi:hypothetical protein
MSAIEKKQREGQFIAPEDREREPQGGEQSPTLAGLDAFLAAELYERAVNDPGFRRPMATCPSHAGDRCLDRKAYRRGGATGPRGKETTA